MHRPRAFFSANEEPRALRLVIASFGHDAKTCKTLWHLDQPQKSHLHIGLSRLLIHDNHLVAAANFTSHTDKPRLYRYNFDGSPGFSGKSYVEVAAPEGGIVTITGLTGSSEGILISGHILQNNEYGFIAHYLTNGTPDTTFGKSGFIIFQINNLNTRAQHLCIRPAGQLLVAGSTRRRLQQKTDGWASQFLSNGTKDPDFNNGEPAIESIEVAFEWKTGSIDSTGRATLWGTDWYGRLRA